MASLAPPAPLTGSCSVIEDNSLYVFSAGSFQTLPLEKGAQWSKLATGVPVSGASCVLAAANSSSNAGDSLWIVGGVPTTPNSSYSGLQKYSFSDKRWQTVDLPVNVAQNLRGHSSVFLPELNSILVYAGSIIDDKTPSSQTFLIGVEEPLTVQSFTSKNFPSISPLLLLWDDASAITFGQVDSPESNIYRFSLPNGWRKLPTSLQGGLKPSFEEGGALVLGSDQSKVLELYDVSVSPNSVRQIVLQQPNGKLARPTQTLGQGNGNGKKRKRSLTIDSWPKYNTSSAPTFTRAGFSLAQSAGGLVAISGGNPQHPVSLFDQGKNTWLDTNSFFGVSDHQSVIGPGPTAIPSSSPTAASGPVDLNDSHPRTSMILGATLGTILGVIALLIILLLLIRWRRRKKMALQAAQNQDEKRLSFADQGDQMFMKEIDIERSATYASNPHSSMAIMSGKVSNHRRQDTRGSDKSTTKLIPRKGIPELNEAMEMEPIKEKSSRESSAQPSDSSQRKSGNLLTVAKPKPKRSSGWSRYFSGVDLLSVGDQSKRASERRSNASGVTPPSIQEERTGSSHDCTTHGPTEIPPLELGQSFHGPRVSRVVTGNLAPNTVNPELQRTGTVSSSRAQSWKGGRPDTIASDISSYPPSTLGETVFTTDQHEETVPWTPMTRSDWNSPRTRDTATSSFYGGHSRQGSEAPIPSIKMSVHDPPVAINPSDIGEDLPSKPANATSPRASNMTLWPNPMTGDFKRTSTEGQPQSPKSALVQPPTAAALRKPEQASFQNDMSWLDLKST